MAILDVTQSPYNADPTTAGDDSAAIQQAIDNANPGDTVYIPAVPNPGVDKYVLDPAGENGLVINADDSGITILGDGFDSHLQFAGGRTANYRGLKIDAGASDVTNVTIEGIRLDGNRANNGGAPNGWGLPIFSNDAASPADDGIVIQGCWAHDWVTTGIECSRGALVQYCTSYDNDLHGIVTAYATNNTNINRIDHCYTHGNGFYGIDFHGKGLATNHRSVNDNYGFKSSSDFGVTDGSGQEHECRNSKFENCGIYGYQQTNAITHIILEDVEVENTQRAGFRFQQDGNIYIRGNGIKAVNTDIGAFNEAAVIVGGANNPTVVDEGAITSVVRVDTTNGRAAVDGRAGAAGNIDTLNWTNASTGYDAGGTLTIDTVNNTTPVGDVTYPTIAEVGAEAWGSTPQTATADVGTLTLNGLQVTTATTPTGVMDVGTITLSAPLITTSVTAPDTSETLDVTVTGSSEIDAIVRYQDNWETQGIQFIEETNIYILVQGISKLNDRLLDDLAIMRENFSVDGAAGTELDNLVAAWGLNRRQGEDDVVLRERAKFTVYADTIRPDFNSYIEFLAALHGFDAQFVTLTYDATDNPEITIQVDSSEVVSNLTQATREELANRALPVGHTASFTYV